jgi:hypothetical protein
VRLGGRDGSARAEDRNLEIDAAAAPSAVRLSATVYLALTFAVPLIATLAAISLSEIDRPSAAQLCA